MRIIARLAVLFYACLTMFIAVALVLFVSHGVPWVYEIPFEKGLTILHFLYYDDQARFLVSMASIFMLLLNYIFIKSISVENEKERTVAFDNPTGRVSVSLDALEDLTRRVIAGVDEVRDVRAHVRVGKKKKRLEIDSRLILNTDVHIPAMTAHLQDLVKQKVQDTIGSEESPEVRIHISKIIPGQRKVKKQKEEPSKKEEQPAVPYQGYRI